MWYLTIPIPNWTGFAIGFVLGFTVFVAWGIWLNRKAKAALQKRIEKR